MWTVSTEEEEEIVQVRNSGSCMIVGMYVLSTWTVNTAHLGNLIFCHSPRNTLTLQIWKLRGASSESYLATDSESWSLPFLSRNNRISHSCGQAPHKESLSIFSGLQETPKWGSSLP